MSPDKSRHIAVLCVENGPDVRIIIAMSLGLDPNITTHLAATGLEAEQMCRGGLDLDAILVGANLSAMSGIDFIRRLQHGDHRPPPPIIIVTASVRPHEVLAFEAAGAKGVIHKPFNPIGLSAQVRALINIG